MRTRFVIHRHLLGPVFRVLPRKNVGLECKWNPEDIPVINPARKASFFVLPKSEYIPCDSKGRTLKNHVETTNVFNCGAEQTSRTEAHRENAQVA